MLKDFSSGLLSYNPIYIAFFINASTNFLPCYNQVVFKIIMLFVLAFFVLSFIFSDDLDDSDDQDESED